RAGRDGLAERQCRSRSSCVPLVHLVRWSGMVALADLLSANGTVDLSLVVLADLSKHGQQHNRPVGRTPVR
ncbi:MAG: hypothetical protein J2P28_25665, partial [Actinobacteria bacterium]|nr:hypothetical protein [Actinomycetota bacterium]